MFQPAGGRSQGTMVFNGPVMEICFYSAKPTFLECPQPPQTPPLQNRDSDHKPVGDILYFRHKTREKMFALECSVTDM